jgi:hypothetical protein
MGEVEMNETKTTDTGYSLQLSAERAGRAVDSLAASLESLIGGEGLPLVVRVPKDTLAKLDLLIEGGLCKSRSEAALQMLERGVEGSDAILAEIAQMSEQIDRMRGELADTAQTGMA